MKHLFHVSLSNNQQISVYRASNLRQLYVNVFDIQIATGKSYDSLVAAYNMKYKEHLEHFKKTTKLNSKVSDNLVKSSVLPYNIIKLQISDSYERYGYQGYQGFYEMYDQLEIKINDLKFISIQLAQVLFDGYDAYEMSNAVDIILRDKPILVKNYGGANTGSSIYTFAKSNQFYVCDEWFKLGTNGNVELPIVFDQNLIKEVAFKTYLLYRYESPKLMESDFIKMYRDAKGNWQRFVSLELIKGYTNTLDSSDIELGNRPFIDSLNTTVNNYLIPFIPVDVSSDVLNKFSGLTQFKDYVRVRTGGYKTVIIRSIDSIHIVFNDIKTGELRELILSFKNWKNYNKSSVNSAIKIINGDEEKSIFVTPETLGTLLTTADNYTHPKLATVDEVYTNNAPKDEKQFKPNINWQEHAIKDYNANNKDRFTNS